MLNRNISLDERIYSTKFRISIVFWSRAVEIIQSNVKNSMWNRKPLEILDFAENDTSKKATVWTTPTMLFCRRGRHYIEIPAGEKSGID